MKQKLFAWGKDFTITDETGQGRFFVDGKAFSFCEQLSFQDMNRNELAFIRQKVFAWGPTYEIYRGGSLFAVVKKELFTFFKCRFTVDVPGPDDLLAQGNFTDHEYQFSRARGVVAVASMKWFTWADTYGVEIADHEDPVIILASTVVIDMACHQDRNRR
jgi:uncharacterized protein YxjI